MFRGFKLLKRYYNLANVKTSLLIVQFIFLLFPALLSTLSPILLANIISAITIYDFSKAIYILSIDFFIIIISTIFYFLYHIISKKINTLLFYNFHEYLYENIKKNKDINSINLQTLTNVSSCIEFNKNFLYKLCFLIKAIITLSIILFYNYIICIAVIIVSFISFVFLRINDKKIQLNTKNLSTLQQKSIDFFNSINKGESVEESFNLNKILKNKYFDIVESQISVNNKNLFLFNINNNFISLILKTTVFISTIYLILLVKSTTLTLSLYLILTPYLTSSAQDLISFFDLFTEFGNIENILNEFESLKFLENKNNNIACELSGFSLYLYHIFYQDEHVDFKDINLEIGFGKIVLIKSNNKNNLNSLLKIILRITNLNSGTIFLDNKNIYELSIEQYRKILTSTSDQPFFFNVSIIENLLMIEQNKKIINKTLKTFNLKNIISKLKNGENTIIDESFDNDLKFLIGLTRSYLSGAKIICIENIPDLNEKYNRILFFILNKFKSNRTTIIFSNNSNFDFNYDKEYFLNKSNLKELKNKNNLSNIAHNKTIKIKES